MAEKIYNRFAKALRHTHEMNKEGWAVLKNNPQIAIYPYLAVLLIFITFPAVNGLAYSIWSHFHHSTLFSVVDNTPHHLRIIFGLVTFSVFYTGLVTSYFTCAVAADVLDRLDGKDVHTLHGLNVVRQNFFKVSKFGLAAIFFFPLGILAQRKRHVKHSHWVIAGSFTTHMPQLAPIIISENKGLFETIRYNIKILTPFWAEGITIRAYMILLFLAASAIGFLPSVIEHHWHDPQNAHFVAWIIGLLVWALGYVTIKVVGTVLTTSLYYHVKTQNNGRGERT